MATVTFMHGFVMLVFDSGPSGFITNDDTIARA
jgi:hypothetical protein